MKQNNLETINILLLPSAQLLEKFKYPNRDAETTKAIEALKRGSPTELQIEIALAEIKNLNLRVKSLVQPEYNNAFPKREIENEPELTSNKESLREAEQKLYGALIKINPTRSRYHKDTLV